MKNPNLLDRISTGDQDAFVQLMREYGPVLYFRLLDRLGDRVLADAAFRQVMLDFYRKLTASGEKDAVAALLVNDADAVSRQLLLDSMERLIEHTAAEAFSVEAAPEIPQGGMLPESLPQEDVPEKPGLLWWTAVTLLVLCTLLVSWVIIGLLVSMEVLPRLDLGYSWFDANVAQWFELQ